MVHCAHPCAMLRTLQEPWNNPDLAISTPHPNPVSLTLTQTITLTLTRTITLILTHCRGHLILFEGPFLRCGGLQHGAQSGIV